MRAKNCLGSVTAKNCFDLRKHVQVLSGQGEGYHVADLPLFAAVSTLDGSGKADFPPAPHPFSKKAHAPDLWHANLSCCLCAKPILGSMIS